MTSAFGNTVLGENKYFFGITDGGKPMGNNKGGTVSGEFFQGFLYHLFAFVVKRGGGFIKNQNRRILQEDSRNGKTLLLTAGKLDSPLSDVGIIAVRKAHDEIMGVGIPGSSDNFCFRCVRTTVADIVHHAPGKQIDILLYNSDVISKTFEREIPDIGSINQYLPV